MDGGKTRSADTREFVEHNGMFLFGDAAIKHLRSMLDAARIEVTDGMVRRALLAASFDPDDACNQEWMRTALEAALREA